MIIGWWRGVYPWILGLFALLAVAACATGAATVRHSFEFDTRKDGQHAVVLDYRYGPSALPVRAPDWGVAEGRGIAFNAVGGPMARGDFLHVKWRDTETGRVYEDNVDLRRRLPPDITDHVIYFMLRGAQLHVYLVSPEGVMRPPGMPSDGPRRYSQRKVVTLYPGSFRD